MRDAIVSALSVSLIIAFSVVIGELAFVGHHQVFVGEASVTSR